MVNRSNHDCNFRPCPSSQIKNSEQAIFHPLVQGLRLSLSNAPTWLGSLLSPFHLKTQAHPAFKILWDINLGQWTMDNGQWTLPWPRYTPLLFVGKQNQISLHSFFIWFMTQWKALYGIADNIWEKTSYGLYVHPTTEIVVSWRNPELWCTELQV